MSNSNDILIGQFERLVTDTGDTRLLKTLAVELGLMVARNELEHILEFQLWAAKALRVIDAMEPITVINEYANGVLSALLDICLVAIETITHDREHNPEFIGYSNESSGSEVTG